MNEQERDSSLLKKERLINKLAVDHQSSFLVTWWFDIAISIKESGFEWSLEYLEVVKQQQYEFWMEKLKQDPWANFSFHESVIQQGNSYWIHDMLYSKYPSILPLRYLPALENFGASSFRNFEIFQEIITELKLSNQAVYLFYVRMSPVIKINLYDLVNMKTESFLPDLEDVAIMALDGSWLIFKSLEGEWVFGRL